MDSKEQRAVSQSDALIDENKLEMINANGEMMNHVEDLEIGPQLETARSSEFGPEIVDETPAESIGSAKTSGGGIAAEHAAESLPVLPESPQSSTAASKSTTPAKGYGLKKWRRIRRDLGTDAPGGTDSAQIHKRRLSLPDPVMIRAGEINKQKSDAEAEGSIVSNSAVPSTAAVVTGALDPDLVLLVASGGFSVGADSDNSEDRSSKSSTAASAPRLRHEAAGIARERSRGKGTGGRGSGHAMQPRSQRGRGGGTDASKKFRGDHFRFNEENSQSSIESEFVRWDSVVSSNGKQSELFINGDGEHSDGVETCEEEIKLGYYKENGRARGSLREDFAVFSYDDLVEADRKEEENNGKNESSRPHTDLDPLVESIVLLQAAQETLETEIQKFGEIGKEITLDDSLLEATEGSGSPVHEAHFLELIQKTEHLEHRLEEAAAAIKAKESKVLELEATLSRTHLLQKATGPENCKEMELELERFVQKRMAAEIEFLITARAAQNGKAQIEDQISLLEEQRSLIRDQAEMMLKLREAENKAAMLKEQADELEARCKELLGTEEVFELQSKVCKSSLCWFIQLVMLSIAFWWFLVQLFLISDEIVPT